MILLVTLVVSSLIGGVAARLLVDRLDAKLSLLRQISQPPTGGSALDHIERAGKAAMARGDMLSRVAHESPVGLVTCDTERILYMNRAAIRICRRDATGLRFEDFIHPDDIDESLDVVDVNAEHGVANLAYVNRWIAEDGQPVPLLWTATPCVNGICYATVRPYDG